MQILVAFDHYSKWCEAKVVADHDAKSSTKLLKNELIYRFSVPKYILIYNGSKWLAKFDQLCKNNGIIHQYTAPQWSRCNGMFKQIVKTLKHGFQQYCLPFQSMPKIGTNIFPRSFLNTNVVYMQALNFLFICFLLDGSQD